MAWASFACQIGLKHDLPLASGDLGSSRMGRDGAISKEHVVETSLLSQTSYGTTDDGIQVDNTSSEHGYGL